MILFLDLSLNLNQKGIKHMKETLVFIDEGFLDKLTKILGGGVRLKFDKFNFAKKIAIKQNLLCKHLFYYTCPPFQSDSPTKDEIKRKKGYDKFIEALSKNNNITIRQGRCQKIINSDGRMDYKQRGVDTLLTIDLSHLREDFSYINKIILVSSDTDFCPIILDIKNRWKIEVILYSYFERKRNSRFSLSNELLKCCSRYVKLTEEDFDGVPLNKQIKDTK